MASVVGAGTGVTQVWFDAHPEKDSLYLSFERDVALTLSRGENELHFGFCCSSPGSRLPVLLAVPRWDGVADL